MPSSLTLPIIDISAFTTSPKNNDKIRRELKIKTAQKIHEACRDVGFFYLTGHNVPQEICEQVLKLANEFFHLEDAEKMKLSILNEDMARGYQRLGENVTKYQKDWHEALDYYKPITRDHYLAKNNLPLRGKNQWPTNPLEFKEVFEKYVNYMINLGEKVMSAIALGLGLEENFFEKFLDDPFWVMRVIGYPPLDSSEGTDRVGVSCGEHTDYGCLTFLNQDNTREALQVQTKEGEWIYANPIPGSFIVNIGDMLNVWTNDVYRSTLHRVIHKGNSYRVSVPFFYEPNFDAKIEPLKRCLEINPVKRYDSVIYGEHLLKKVSGNFEIVDKQAS
ncbi:9356_t:CDS:10 [Acaulospora morrowiae]|uniref:9356_t:CDS:1 n=1 Tax=Acaulospora morrowiae TaxID=94023 RepID=A0A9N9HMT9_9GLOM|nr:9356_t:CDS:10 [Acaulospora morrowiae]